MRDPLFIYGLETWVKESPFPMIGSSELSAWSFGRVEEICEQSQTTSEGNIHAWDEGE